jgi:hypothetical protein
MNPAAAALRDVVMVIEPLAGVEQHDVGMPRQLLQIRRDKCVISGVSGSAVLP